MFLLNEFTSFAVSKWARTGNKPYYYFCDLASLFSVLHFPETVSTNIFLRCEGSDCTLSGTGRMLVTIESSDEQIGQLVAKGQTLMLNLFGFIGICCLKESSRRSSRGSVG